MWRRLGWFKFKKMFRLLGNTKGELMAMRKKWTREEAVKVFETLLERGCTLLSGPQFRNQLDRNGNLLSNQFTREANGNLAYRSVAFEITEEMSDEEFWTRIDKTPYNEMIEENAAIALQKMAEKLNLTLKKTDSK